MSPKPKWDPIPSTDSVPSLVASPSSGVITTRSVYAGSNPTRSDHGSPCFDVADTLPTGYRVLRTLSETNKSRIFVVIKWPLDDEKPGNNGVGSSSTPRRIDPRQVFVLKRFQQQSEAVREIEVLELKCTHPNVVLYRDYRFHADGGCSIDMELMDFGCLKHLVLAWQQRAQQCRAIPKISAGVSASPEQIPSSSSSNHRRPSIRPLPTLQQRLDIARAAGLQTVCGLLFLWVMYNQLHRDIKPGNLLLRRDGRVKIADFDSGRRIGDDSNNGLYYANNIITIQGTLTYMAPEIIDQSLGKGDFSRCDIWSLAIVLLELGLGTHPFASAPILDLLSETSRATAAIHQAIPWNNFDSREYNENDRTDASQTFTNDSLALEVGKFRDLIEHCLQVRPSERMRLEDVYNHPFFDKARHHSSGSECNELPSPMNHRMKQVEQLLTHRGCLVGQCLLHIDELKSWKERLDAETDEKAKDELNALIRLLLTYRMLPSCRILKTHLAALRHMPVFDVVNQGIC